MKKIIIMSISVGLMFACGINILMSEKKHLNNLSLNDTKTYENQRQQKQEII